MAKSISDRDRIWQKLQPEIQTIEAERQRRRPLGIAWIIGGLAALVVALWTGLQIEDGPWRIGSIALGFGGVMAQLIGFGQLNLHGSRFELLVRNAVFENAGLTFKKTVKDYPTERFRTLGLAPDYDEGRFRDQVAGQIFGISIQMCQAELVKRISKRNSKTLFKGILLASSFPEPILSRTTVFPDPTKTGYAPNLNALPGEPVQIGSSGAADLYEVYSSDPVEANHLLTASFMDRLMDIQKQLQARDDGAIVCLGLADQTLLLAVLGNKPWFEPPKGRPRLDDPSIVDGYLSDLARLQALVRLLILDDRTKP